MQDSSSRKNPRNQRLGQKKEKIDVGAKRTLMKIQKIGRKSESPNGEILGNLTGETWIIGEEGIGSLLVRGP